MRKEPLTEKVIARICKHMNQDHHEALIEYAIQYGGVKHPKQVKLINLSKSGIKLLVDEDIIAINFQQPISSSEDAHKALVSMFKALPRKPKQD